MKKDQCGIFGARLAELRQKKELTQSELAEKLGVQRVTIAKNETAQRAPSIDSLILFSEFFQVSTDYLLGLSDNATTDTDLKAVCDYTGLNEEAINTIKMLKNENFIEALNIMICSKFINIVEIITKMKNLSLNLDTNQEFIEKAYNECLKSVDISKIKSHNNPFILAHDENYCFIYDTCECLLDEKLNYLEYRCFSETLKAIPGFVAEDKIIGLDKISTLIYKMYLEKGKENPDNVNDNKKDE